MSGNNLKLTDMVEITKGKFKGEKGFISAIFNDNIEITVNESKYLEVKREEIKKSE